MTCVVNTLDVARVKNTNIEFNKRKSMKLTNQLKTFAAQVKNTFSGWTIRRRGNWRRTYRINLIPSVEYVRWKSQRGPSAQPFVAEYNVIEHCVEVGFLSAYYTLSIYKETKI